MPARIVIQTRISADTVFWIEKSVVRIGSDPHMDLTIPSDDLDSHALTVEFRDGQYRVHNRCSAAVYLGGRTVAPSQSDLWLDTDLLELPGVIQLAMEFEGNPAPAVAPRHTPSMPVESSDRSEVASADSEAAVLASSESRPNAATRDGTRPNADAAKRSSSTLIQIAVTILCLVGCVLLLTWDRSRDLVDSADVPKFERIVEAGLEQSDPTVTNYLRHLQYAEATMIRGNTKAARKRYAAMRSMLLHATGATAPPTTDSSTADSSTADSSTATSDELPDQMMKWVEYRLTQL